MRLRRVNDASCSPEPVRAMRARRAARAGLLDAPRSRVARGYMLSTIALPNSEHFKSFAPVIRRSKS
jgi:hypothetical protein